MSKPAPDHILDSFFRHAPVFVLQLDAKLGIVRAGEKFREVTGHGQGDSFADSLDRFTASQTENFFKELAKTGEGGERVFHHPLEGGNRPYTWIWTAVTDESGACSGFLGMGRPAADDIDRLREELSRVRADEERRAKELVKLQHQVKTQNHNDELTGLGNRRYILDRLETEVPRAIRYDEPLTILLIDVDHLDRVNEDFGQVKGDEVIGKIAEVVREQVRATDLAARYDGEQFMVLCPHTDRASAQFLAERLRRRVSECSFHADREEFGVTVSTGLVTVRAGNEFDVEAILRACGEALQAAKDGGKNRVQLTDVR